MRLYIIKFLIFSVTVLSGIGIYHTFNYQTRNKIFSLTEKFHEAFKNQDEDLINQIVADNLENTSDNSESVYGKSDLIAGMRLYRNDRTELVSIKITPLWVQADREKPSYTFETKTTVLFDGNPEPSIYYGQYTFIFEKRETDWEIVSMNFDVNYVNHKPHWFERKLMAIERNSKSISRRFSNFY